MKKILVTGSAGFIGDRTARMLVEQGNEVVGIDSMNDAYDPRLKHHRIERQGNIAGLEFVEGDIEDQDFLGKIFQEHRFDSVLNLAARAGVRYSMENPTVYLQTNAQGTLNLMEEMRNL
jgi:nucleoside-diphosphate-sugar epimerase